MITPTIVWTIITPLNKRANHMIKNPIRNFKPLPMSPLINCPSPGTKKEQTARANLSKSI